MDDATADSPLTADGDTAVRGACPLDCPDTCSWIVTVEDGEAVALRGDPGHPYTRGSLCNKVDGYLAYARSADRLLYPMRRVGPKGSGEFVRISWDEALDAIATRLQRRHRHRRRARRSGPMSAPATWA